METLTINSLLSCVLTVILQLLLGMFLVWHGNFALGDKRPLRRTCQNNAGSGSVKLPR